jgi:hypothetical protein
LFSDMGEIFIMKLAAVAAVKVAEIAQRLLSPAAAGAVEMIVRRKLCPSNSSCSAASPNYEPRGIIVPGHHEVILHLTRLPISNFECPQSTKRHTKFFRKLTWIRQILDRKIDVGNFRTLFVIAVRPLLLSFRGHRNLPCALWPEVRPRPGLRG